MSRAKNFVATDFICDESFWSDLVDRRILSYCEFGREVCPTSERSHLQVFCCFYNPRSVSAVRQMFSPRHVEPMRGRLEHNKRYCRKSGDYVTLGKAPATDTECGQMEKDRWVGYLKLAREGRFAEIPPKVYITHDRAFQRVWRDFRPTPSRLEPEQLKCFWIYGPTGVGKSRVVWDRLESSGTDFYVKMANNKWWDGYADEESVYYEDFPKDGKYLSYHIKVICDIYPVRVEVKGGAMFIRPKTIVVTSNFSIAEVFGDPFNDSDLKAIQRRFVEVHMTEPGQFVFDQDPRPEMNCSGHAEMLAYCSPNKPI